MDRWIVVDHSEVGLIVLPREEFDTLEPALDPVQLLFWFRSFSEALSYVEELLGIPTDPQHCQSPLTCTWGPGAPAFAVIRDRPFGMLHGVYTRQESLPRALLHLDARVESWFRTRTAATRELCRRVEEETRTILRTSH